MKKKIFWVLLVMAMFCFTFAITANAAESLSLPSDAPEGTIASVKANIIGNEEIATTYCADFEELQQTLYKYRTLGYVRCSHKYKYNVEVTLYSDIDLGEYTFMIYDIEEFTLDFNGYTISGYASQKGVPIVDTCEKTQAEEPYHTNGNATPFGIGTDSNIKDKSGYAGVITLHGGVYSTNPKVTFKNGRIIGKGQVPDYNYRPNNDANSQTCIHLARPSLVLNSMYVEAQTNLDSALRLNNGTHTAVVENSTLKGPNKGIYVYAGSSLYIKDSVVEATTDFAGQGIAVYSYNQYPSGYYHSCSLERHDVVLQIEGDKTYIYGSYHGIFVDVSSMIDSYNDNGNLVTNEAQRNKHFGKVIIKGGTIAGGNKNGENSEPSQGLYGYPPAALYCISGEWKSPDEGPYMKSIVCDVEISGGKFEQFNDKFSAVIIETNSDVTVSGGEFIGGNGSHSMTDRLYEEFLEAAKEMGIDTDSIISYACGLEIGAAKNVNITGGSFNGSCGLSVDSQATIQKFWDLLYLIVYGEEISILPDVTIANVNISGGSFNGTESALNIDYARYKKQDAEMLAGISTAVSGGAYTGAVTATECGKFITGGTYSVAPDDKDLGEGMNLVRKDGIFEITDEAVDAKQQYLLKLELYVEKVSSICSLKADAFSSALDAVVAEAKEALGNADEADLENIYKIYTDKIDELVASTDHIYVVYDIRYENEEKGFTVFGVKYERCECGKEIITQAAPIFTAKGYSISEDGTSVMGGYKVNIEARDEYNKYSDNDITYGVLFAYVEKSYGDSVHFEDENVIKVNVEGENKNYSSFNFRLEGFDPKNSLHADGFLMICAYATDGTRFDYIQTDKYHDYGCYSKNNLAKPGEEGKYAGTYMGLITLSDMYRHSEYSSQYNTVFGKGQ